MRIRHTWRHFWHPLPPSVMIFCNTADILSSQNSRPYCRNVIYERPLSNDFELLAPAYRHDVTNGPLSLGEDFGRRNETFGIVHSAHHECGVWLWLFEAASVSGVAVLTVRLHVRALCKEDAVVDVRVVGCGVVPGPTEIIWNKNFAAVCAVTYILRSNQLNLSILKWTAFSDLASNRTITMNKKVFIIRSGLRLL